MNRRILGLALVTVFCITWWIVAGEACKKSIQAEQEYKQHADDEGGGLLFKMTSAKANEHFRTQSAWGLGAGLLADVLLLVGAVAWSKLTTPKT
jgi:hypothetical protein